MARRNKLGEQWKPVEGYDGYEVSNEGRVYSTKTDRMLHIQEARR